MTLTALAAIIADLTHCADRLEVLQANVTLHTGQTHGPLTSEVAHLHSVIDRLNAAYEAQADREADDAFENGGR